MSVRMIKLYITTFFMKFKMKYITHEMVNEDIFPLFEPVDPIREYKRDATIEELIERLG